MKEDCNISIFEVIPTRTSWRTFQDRDIDEDLKIEISQMLQKVKKGIFGTNLRFELIDIPKDNRAEKRKLGTYGFISGAPSYVAGAVEKSKTNIIEYGYEFEIIILFLTKCNLGTCWLGGTFNKSSFAQKIDLRENEVLPAISPIGYIPDKRRLVGKIIRSAIRAKIRKDFDQIIFENSFETPLKRENTGTFEKPLEMIRVGPSAKNKQPWRIVLERDVSAFHFFIQSEDKNTTKKIYNFQKLDLGIAMCHFELSCNELGYYGDWKFQRPSNFQIPEDKIYQVSWYLNV